MGPRVSATMASRVAGASRAQSLVASQAPVTTSTVDIIIGYTVGFATRLGGTSQAITRLRFLLDTTNQAFVNSRVGGTLRAAQFVQVDFPDETNNRETLFQLTGVACSPVANTGELPDGGVSCSLATRPAALEVLSQRREQFGADLVTLVRAFDNDTNGSCGIGWKLGGGQTPITAASAAFAYSVVSDSSGSIFTDGGANCRDDNLAHEVGHNFGLQHDVAIAAGADDTNGDGNLLDPEEFGRFADSFGYFAAPEAGDFFDTMAVRRSGKDGILVYSNPSVGTCNGFACGVTNQANAARTLSLTIPQVAAFRNNIVPVVATGYRGDFDGDGKADLLWRNGGTGQNVYWRGAVNTQPTPITSAPDLDWVVAAIADFNGDHKDDILWRHSTTRATVIWLSANSATTQAVTSWAAQWNVVGAGDFNGDGKEDIFLRNFMTGANVIWRSGNSTTPQGMSAQPNMDMVPVAVGDFNNDGKDDILWRNVTTGQNLLWLSGNAGTVMNLTTAPPPAWLQAG
jgi:hypothetical protein